MGLLEVFALLFTLAALVIAVVPLFEKRLIGNWKLAAALAAVDVIVFILVLLIGWWFNAVVWGVLTVWTVYRAYDFYGESRAQAVLDNHQHV